jgi:hypothetical protein
VTFRAILALNQNAVVSKKILFPFSFEKDFHRGYSWTMELASRMNATPFFFTVLPARYPNDQNRISKVYHSLLEARGNYLQYFHDAKNVRAIPKTERLIEKGDFTWSLIKFVKKTKFDIIVVDLQASELSPTTLQDVVENANGVIVLPDQKESPDHSADGTAKGVEKKITQDFYDILGQSNLYKVPSYFFQALGRDKKVFNYLRSLFRKNQNPY